jgi:hypothetical protein
VGEVQFSGTNVGLSVKYSSDAGMSGIAGNGEAIICEDNNGLRWEPA